MGRPLTVVWCRYPFLSNIAAASVSVVELRSYFTITSEQFRRYGSCITGSFWKGRLKWQWDRAPYCCEAAVGDLLASAVLHNCLRALCSQACWSSAGWHCTEHCWTGTDLSLTQMLEKAEQLVLQQRIPSLCDRQLSFFLIRAWEMMKLCSYWFWALVRVMLIANVCTLSFFSLSKSM